MENIKTNLTIDTNETQSKWIDKVIIKETAWVNNSVSNILNWNNLVSRQKEVLWKVNFADQFKWQNPFEQIATLWLPQIKWWLKEYKEASNDGIFGAPNKTITLWWAYDMAA